MTDDRRRAHIVMLDLLLQELRAEQRIADWLESHTSATVFSYQSFNYGGLEFVCRVRNQYGGLGEGVEIAQGYGVTESDARAQAFQAIFANEAAAKQEATT